MGPIGIAFIFLMGYFSVWMCQKPLIISNVGLCIELVKPIKYLATHDAIRLCSITWKGEGVKYYVLVRISALIYIHI